MNLIRNFEVRLKSGALFVLHDDYSATYTNKDRVAFSIGPDELKELTSLLVLMLKATDRGPR